MENKLAISIIVPVYNNEKYLEKCLNSILNQTFQQYEIIIINDGSTDKSGAICRAYAEKESRITVIDQDKRGVSAARNLGVQRAVGTFIGFVDGDDYIDENMYEYLYEACIRTGSDISICKLGRKINGKITNEIDDDYELILEHETAMEELFKGELYRFSLCNKLFNKSCFDHVTFPVGRIHEDLSTTYKLFAHANQAVYLNYIGYIYVKQKDSILSAAYYEKRLDAFVGWKEILTFMEDMYPHLINQVNACFTYNCVDHAFYILQQVSEKQMKLKYLKKIRTSIRRVYLGMIKNKLISVKSKLIVTLLCVNIPIFTFLFRLKDHC